MPNAINARSSHAGTRRDVIKWRKQEDLAICQKPLPEAPAYVIRPTTTDFVTFTAFYTFPRSKTALKPTFITITNLFVAQNGSSSPFPARYAPGTRSAAALFKDAREAFPRSRRDFPVASAPPDAESSDNFERRNGRRRFPPRETLDCSRADKTGSACYRLHIEVEGCRLRRCWYRRFFVNNR